MTTTKTLHDDLNTAFVEYKTTQCARDIAEKNGQDTDVFDQKMTMLTSFIDRVENRLQRLEIDAKGLAHDGLPAPSMLRDNIYEKAFVDYVRRGNEQGLLMDQKALSTGSDKDGGYLMPTVMHYALQEELENLSPIRTISNVISVSSDGLDMLMDRGDASVGWVAEQADRFETKMPDLVKRRIPVHEMYAKPRATQKLLDDAAIDVEKWISKKVAETMAQLENQAFINGDGKTAPRGFLTYVGANGDQLGCLKTGVNGAFSKDHGADVLIDTLHSLKGQYLPGACWVMPRSAQAAVRRLRDPATGQHLWQPSLIQHGDRPGGATLLGYPIVIVDDMPALVSGTPSCSVAFGNFKMGYQIVDRDGVHVLRDPYSAKPYVEFYTTRRVGGDVICHDAIKVINFSA